MSSIDLSLRYLAERGRPRVLVPLALVLAATGALISAPPVSPAAVAMSAVQALLLVLSFRVWDDLADRERDAIEHPARITVLAAHRPRPFVALGAAFAALAVTSMLFERDLMYRAIALALAVMVLEIWYSTRSVPGSAVGGHVVLLKYPAVAYAVAPRLSPAGDESHSLRTAALLASLYLLIGIYEYFDDPAMRASARARRVAVTELALLIPLVIAIVGLP